MDASGPDPIVADDLVFCFFIGLGMNTPIGRATWERMENSLFQRPPGYALFRSLTQQLTGKAEDKTWKPALVEIEDALVPAFIIEEMVQRPNPFVVPEPRAKSSDGHTIPGCNPEHPGRQNLVDKTAWLPW
jgi:hypothetical protein